MYYMAVAASGPNTEILQFDWFISGRIFLVLPAQEGNLKKPYLCRIKIQIFDNTCKIFDNILIFIFN